MIRDDGLDLAARIQATPLPSPALFAEVLTAVLPRYADDLYWAGRFIEYLEVEAWESAAVALLVRTGHHPHWSLKFDGVYFRAELYDRPPFCGRHVNAACALLGALVLSLTEVEA